MTSETVTVTAPRRSTIAQTTARVVLLVFFTGVSLGLGGAVYSGQVVEHLWSSDPPESLRQWAPAMTAAGRNFWGKITPLIGLLALLTLATAFATRGAHRWWRIAASLLFIAVLVASIVYFVPGIGKLTPPALDSLSAAEATAMVHQWTRLDSLRAVTLFVVWLCALRAITLPVQPDDVR